MLARRQDNSLEGGLRQGEHRAAYVVSHFVEIPPYQEALLAVKPSKPRPAGVGSLCSRPPSLITSLPHPQPVSLLLPQKIKTFFPLT